MADRTWVGHVRTNGSVRIRNKILAICAMGCPVSVTREIAGLADDSETEMVGFSGYTSNKCVVCPPISLIRHPNIGGILAVDLGCEYVQPQWLVDIVTGEEKEAIWMFIRDQGGTKSSIDQGLVLVKHMKKAMGNTPREPMRFGDLVIGAECGRSNFASGLAGDAVTGRLFGQLVDTGGTTIFEEIVEVVGLKCILVNRATGREAAEDLVVTYDRALEYCRSVRQYSVNPGNFMGGLSTIEEKSVGAVAKSGSRSIQGMLKVGRCPPRPGLWLLDPTPGPHWIQFGIMSSNNSEGLMDLISCGCHLVLLVTSRGDIIGSTVALYIKLTGNSDTYRRMEGDIDSDAGPVLDGACAMETLTRHSRQLVTGVASGYKSKSEALGHKEYFIPYRYQEEEVIRPCGR